jgi:hypothetical protein
MGKNMEIFGKILEMEVVILDSVRFCSRRRRDEEEVEGRWKKAMRLENCSVV